jgi:hypothetical protein
VDPAAHEMNISDRYGMFDIYLRGMGELVTGGRVAAAWTSDGTGLGYIDGPPITTASTASTTPASGRR